MNTKEVYTSPELEIVKFECEDVIDASDPEPVTNRY